MYIGERNEVVSETLPKEGNWFSVETNPVLNSTT